MQKQSYHQVMKVLLKKQKIPDKIAELLPGSSSLPCDVPLSTAEFELKVEIRLQKVKQH